MTDLRIRLPDDFDFTWVLGFLAARTVPSLESVAAGEYRRSVRLNGKPVTIVIREEPNVNSTERWLVASSRPALSDASLHDAITRLLDLGADLDRFRRLTRRDPILGSSVRRRAGIRLPQLLDPFEGLTRAILGQQVSVAGASTMADRLVRVFSRPIPGAKSSGFFAFPEPADVADAGDVRLREIGLTRARAATLVGVARALADGGLDLDHVRQAPADEAQAALEGLPGIGPWTASYVRMRALGDRDAFPAADLGVIKAFAAAGVDRKAITAAAERWRPWRAYATLHLWASLHDAR